MAAYRPERAGRDADERGNMLNANSPHSPTIPSAAGADDRSDPRPEDHGADRPHQQGRGGQRKAFRWSLVSGLRVEVLSAVCAPHHHRTHSIVIRLVSDRESVASER